MITNIVECHNLFLTPGNTGYDNMLQGLRVPTVRVVSRSGHMASDGLKHDRSL